MARCWGLHPSTHWRWVTGKCRAGRLRTVRIAESVRQKVIAIDRRYRMSWDARSIAHVVDISPTTVAAILRHERGPRPKPARRSHDRRTRFLARDVMYSSDFMKLPDGRCLIKTLDEASRFKLGWCASESETARVAVRHGEGVIEKMGRAPLLWKYDHGSAFTSGAFQEFLARHKILPYPIPPRSPWVNGRVERDHREIRNWLIAVEELGLAPGQMDREVDEGMFLLNFKKPRAVLGFKTSAEAYFSMPGIDGWGGADREDFRMETEDLKCRIGRAHSERTHRKAIRQALQSWGLYEEWDEKPRKARIVNRSEALNVAI